MLTSKQRAALRAVAGSLQPVFQIGKEGMGEALMKATEDCLAARELVKLRVLETSPEPVKDVAETLSRATGAQVVQVIGRVFVLFKAKEKESQFGEVLGRRVKKARPAGTKKPKPAAKGPARPAARGEAKPKARAAAKPGMARRGEAAKTGARATARPGMARRGEAARPGVRAGAATKAARPGAKRAGRL